MLAAACAMTPEQARAIYFAGQDAVLTSLCELDLQVQALQQQIEALQRKVAQLSKDSSNSSKRPSSDDITKPKGGKKTRRPDEKGNKIGGHPGHPKHTRAPYPPEAISLTHEHESMACPLCGAHDVLWVEDLPARVIQQTEIKEVVVIREEHRAYAYWCSACGQSIMPSFLRTDLPAINAAKVLKQFEKHLISVGIVGM